jgi:hypothetical protein
MCTPHMCTPYMCTPAHVYLYMRTPVLCVPHTHIHLMHVHPARCTLWGERVYMFVHRETRTYEHKIMEPRVGDTCKMWGAFIGELY